MRVMSAGDGYRYLIDSVAVGDGQRDPARALTSYYDEAGTPPGRWLGAGLPGLGDGAIGAGDRVTEEQLARLLGQGRDPVTGRPLGRAFPSRPSLADRVAARLADLPADLDGQARADAEAAIRAEETARRTRRAVAGYDFTFSAPKSVSVWWALADEPTRRRIVAAHHAAIADTIALMEAQVAATRTGVDATDGAVAQVDVDGLIATAFDHHDSRNGDPQLHTHVVIANKVRTCLDGKWRSLDGRPVHAAVVALSEHYNAVLADLLTRDLGVGWEQRDRGPDRNPAWEITGVNDDLLTTFSTRAGAIRAETDRLIADYRANHGRTPSATTILKLRARATLTTRPDKTVRSLVDLTRRWRATATTVLDHDPDGWASAVPRANGQPALTSDDIPEEVVEGHARMVLDGVAERRSTWRHWNLRAEASRQTMGIRLASPADRHRLTERIVGRATDLSVRLSPPDPATVPDGFTRPDGTSRFRPRHHTLLTSPQILAAEDRLLRLSRTTDGPTIPRSDEHTDGLDDGQQAAVGAIGESGRPVEVLVGPAGTGKTTTMTALRHAWEQTHGAGAVIGLAPSASAAHVLAQDLGIPTDNTAKWLHDHTRGTTRLTAGQLVIIDEASLASTPTLDQIALAATRAGAKVLLVGDPAQLGPVAAGGAFALLTSDRPDHPRLTTPHRFHQPWEATASLRLRDGDPDVLHTYRRHDRIRHGDTDTMLHAAHQAWRTDLDRGLTSLLIAPDHTTVTALNQLARDHRITTGHVNTDAEVVLADGSRAGTGDLVITRRNNRRQPTGDGWVRNGDRWTVTATHPDGAITVQPDTGGPAVRLDPAYTATHVQLGYAITTHRAQGATTDTAHAVAGPGMTREILYVAMTRGRHANTVWVATDQPDLEPHQHHPDPPTGLGVLRGVLARTGNERSAHHTVRDEQHRWTGIAQLAAEYETIAAAAQHHRWTAAIRTSGLTNAQAAAALRSDAFGPLTAALRLSEAHHTDPEQLLQQAVAARTLDGADDIAAVLHHRISNALHRLPRQSDRPPRMVAGIIPQALGPMPADAADALAQRHHLIEDRARALARTAINDRAAWTRQLGPRPPDGPRRRAWEHALVVVAAYRDRYEITGDAPLGTEPGSTARRAAAQRAHRAIQRVRADARATPDVQSGVRTRSSRSLSR